MCKIKKHLFYYLSQSNINIIISYTMPYVEDENGNKFEYTVRHEMQQDIIWKEPIHVNDDGHLDTEDRHLIIKDGTQPNHAISLSQLQSHTEDTIKPLIDNSIRQSLVQLDSDIKGLLENMMRTKVKPLIISTINEALKKS